MSSDEPIEDDRKLLVDPVDGLDGDSSSPSPTTALAPSPSRSLESPDPFRRYLAEVKRYPRLSREEERDLARRYRETGDREALFRLVTANLMLVVRTALSFRRAARNLLDLVQEGNIGLLQAIDRFDPELGVRLPTYAAWWIRAYMVKFLLDNVRMVRAGTTNARRKLLHNLQREKRRLEEEGFEVAPKLLAERFGVSEEDVRDIQAALSSRDLSLSEPIGEDEDRTRADTLPSAAPSVEADVARRELQRRAERAIALFRAELNERERAILDEHILGEEPLTLQALGDRFGTTREAVRQMEARVSSRLRDFLRSELSDLSQIRIGPD